jgi:hypothetical protein
MKDARRILLLRDLPLGAVAFHPNFRESSSGNAPGLHLGS